jgi:hypothetical protein
MIEERYPLLDNARPTWKVVLSAILHEELPITGQLVAEALLFLQNFRIPLQDYVSSALLGWRPKARSLRHRDIDALTSTIYIESLREKIQELRADPVFKRNFDATLQELDDTQWERLLNRSEAIEQEVKEFLQDSETEAQSRSLFSKTDNYQQAAKFIALHHPGIRVVIMGHTHMGIDRKQLHVEGNKKEFLYYNTGTWTKSYDIPWWKLPRLEALHDPKLYAPNSSVIRCIGAGDNLVVKYFDSWKEAVSNFDLL